MSTDPGTPPIASKWKDPPPPEASLLAPPRAVDEEPAIAPPPSDESPPGEKAAQSPAPRRHRGLMQTALATLTSLVLHMAVLLGLSFWLIGEEKRAELISMVIDNRREDDLREALVAFELDQQDHPASTLTFASAGGQLDSADNIEVDATVLERLNKNLRESKEATVAEIGGLALVNLRRGELLSDVPYGAPGKGRSVVDGYEEALDRITQEILQMLEKDPVLVIWCFDRSESMKDDQREIGERIERVYTELGLSKRTTGGRLQTAITSFGNDFRVETPKPLTEPHDIHKTIASLAIDPSGEERTCEAITLSLSNFRKLAGRNGRRLAFILVSDESGNRDSNVAMLEPTIALAKETEARIYVLGREAVFGYPFARFRWRHPQTNRPYWLLTDRGPETAFVEQLQTNGFRRRHDAFASGFGPYEQSRMARETGGIFFMLPSVESNIIRGEKRRYELEQMRYYQPDLRAREQIFFDRENKELRIVLWKIIHDLDPYNPQGKEVTEVRVHYSPDPSEFARQVRAQLPRAKLYLQYLHEASEFLKANRAARETEPEIRWRANYDLMLAQLVAYQARLFEYGAYLEHFMQTPKVVPLTKPPNLRLIHWDITTRQETLTGEVIAPLVDEANALFEEVIRQHPGTPWAERAEWEMRRGYGVQLVPDYEPPYVEVPNAMPIPKL